MTRKITLLLLASILLLIANRLITRATTVKAQTVGEQIGLNGITWTWKNQQAPVPETVLFTPPYDSDFLITMYLSIASLPENTSLLVCPELSWTDESGPQLSNNQVSNLCNQFNVGDLPPNTPGNYSISFPIHVLANTSVSLAIGTAASAPYTFVVGKIRMNP